MPKNKENLFEQISVLSKDRRNLWKIVASLSFSVILVVFWSLKLTGIGIAGEAFCGQEEHVHSESCTDCQIQEHIHIASCYSNINADL